jgi:hypothetical protein
LEPKILLENNNSLAIATKIMKEGEKNNNVGSGKRQPRSQAPIVGYGTCPRGTLINKSRK